MRLIALAVVVSCLAAAAVTEAQQTGKLYRIGVLETRSATLNAPNIDAFRRGLRELGYKDGQNLELVYRSSDGRNERFPALASELVDLKVDLILTRGTPAALAAKNATRTIPVVMASSGDPVGAGIVVSLGRPGGNVTGLSNYNVEIYAKRVELLKELLPRITRIAGLFNMGNPVLPIQWNVAERAARSLGMHAQLLDARRPEDLPRAFDAATKEHAEAMVVALDGVTQANLPLIAELAAKHRLPAIFATSEYVDVGGLMSYGASDPHLYQRAAAYVDRIFKGASPGSLPIEQPTKFELALNVKTARALGLTIPPALLQRADQVVN
jgi:putative tryptophan/tyrosine transport system substrate-binding protein